MASDDEDEDDEDVDGDDLMDDAEDDMDASASGIRSRTMSARRKVRRSAGAGRVRRPSANEAFVAKVKRAKASSRDAAWDTTRGLTIETC